MTTKSTELIHADPFTSGKPDSILAGLWRQILRDQKIDNAMLYEKISMYADGLTKVPFKRRAQIRGNMRTDAFKENLTWYTFTKNLRAIHVSSISIEFECRHVRRSSSHTLTVELNDDFAVKDKGTSVDEAEASPLSHFFAEVMFNLGIDYSMFEILLEIYMRRTTTEHSPQSKNDLRAYFRKEFRSTKMSWNSLIKGFSFMCILNVKMHVTLTQSFGFKSSHVYAFALADLDDFNEEKEKDVI